MEKIAILNLNSESVKMQLINVNKNKSFSRYKEIEMPINLTKDFYVDYFIKPNIVKDIISTLIVYRKMIDKEEIKTCLCYASCLFKEAKNNNGVLNEILNATGFQFNVVGDQDEINAIYTAVINTFNKPKGLIVYIGNFNTTLVLYNRRNILETKYIAVGYDTLYRKYYDANKTTEKFMAEVKKAFTSEIKNLEWMSTLAEEFEVVGVGNMFMNLGVLSRKARHYSLNLSHNYDINKDDLVKVMTALKGQDMTKPTKVKEISIEDSKYLLTAFTMIDVLLNKTNKSKITVSRTGFNEGIAFGYAIPLTIEKPISDTLGYSLQTINEYYDNSKLITQQVYNISMILFKQLKVLHKLGRQYVRILRIASYLHDAGERVSQFDIERVGFDVVLNSEIYGVSHADILMAAFVVKLCNMDNFNLSDWVRYKDILTEENMQAVKKLAVILNIAQSLNITGFGSVVDINCDILGDSVIMKTIVEQPADIEIKKASLVASEFKKAFNKNLQII